MDGGLGQLLCGTKDGQFSPVAVGTRGFAVSGDAKSLAVSDINGDGRPGLLVGVSDAPTWLLYIPPPAYQSPFYPGTSGTDEKGEGRGLGFTLNVPLPAGSGDADYAKAFEERLKPAAAAIQPDLVLISVGFDAARDDLLGRMNLTPEGYAQLTRIRSATKLTVDAETVFNIASNTKAFSVAALAMLAEDGRLHSLERRAGASFAGLCHGAICNLGRVTR
jgi:hypothetical protein